MLKEIMLRHGTDKVQGHNYAEHYEWHFRDLREKVINLFEIGVGGYNVPYIGGNSLRAWKEYFPNADIYSLDIYDKSTLEEDRIHIYQGSQVDPDILTTIYQDSGDFDIIIDDGSHVNTHIIKSFEFLFPLLKSGGVYVIEDVQTSYFPELKGGNITTMEYFTKLLDGLNYKERVGYYTHTYYDRNITSIHFYHNLIFIHKGDNSEESNIVRNNER